ncbi:MAG: tRNA 4-thiouridine(8) synthase ThiI [Epulopiscium sp. Nele67-Bin005]|nr:MAG: tRNA 4-thiouridine(8) synthase ThiI [Epulopiscium sp. Nele67-Bin005]
MKNVFLIKYGELAIKGKNRPIFENRLVKTVKKNLKVLGNFNVHKEQGRLIVEPNDEFVDKDAVIEMLTRIFGIIGVAYGTKEEEVTLEAVERLAYSHMKNLCEDANGQLTFKIETKRADKRFPLKSMEVSSTIGGYLLDEFGDKLKVDVHNPDVTLMVEIRNGTYVYSKTYKGSGGMPYGTNGKATLLLSGGIDSPVAGWLIAKRGVEVDAVYFHSPPYTSERAKDKVIELAKKVAVYTGSMRVHIVPFTDIQMAIHEKCPHQQLTIIMRRLMMDVTEAIADKNNSMALITGESIGQVASQTIHGLVATDDAAKRPVFRPLIGMDKEEIIQIAKKIDTFETSILPYEDCCTIFVPKHPETKPKLDRIIESQSKLDDVIEQLLQEAIDNTEVVEV